MVKHPDSLRNGAHNYSKLYNIDIVRGLHPRISTIMHEWCLQWPQVYKFKQVESAMIPVSTFSTEWSH